MVTVQLCSKVQISADQRCCSSIGLPHEIPLSPTLKLETTNYELRTRTTEDSSLSQNETLVRKTSGVTRSGQIQSEGFTKLTIDPRLSDIDSSNTACTPLCTDTAPQSTPR